MHSTNTAGAGKSSYDLIDAPRFWRKLPLKPDMTVLDLGCGQGRYSLAIAEHLGPAGKIIALDSWTDGIVRLQTEAEQAKLSNISAQVSDAAEHLPLPDHHVDLCLLATVLHDFVIEGISDHVLKELKRVIKPQGILYIVEFRKIDPPPGPPRNVRLALEDLTVMLQPLGLIRFSAEIDLGPYLYGAYYRNNS